MNTPRHQDTSPFWSWCLNSICILNFTWEKAALHSTTCNVHKWFNLDDLALFTNRCVYSFMCTVFILSSHIKWQHFLASSHLEWWCLFLSPILTCKNIKAWSVGVSHNGETERSFTACGEFPCFKLHQLWIWNWSLSSEIQIWANSVGLLIKLPQVLHMCGGGQSTELKANSVCCVLKLSSNKRQSLCHPVLTERWINISLVPQNETD